MPMDQFAPDLGLGPAPTAPMVPQPTSTDPSKSQKWLQLAMMALAGGLGPGAGTGVLKGLHNGTQQRQQEAHQKDATNRFQYEQEQQNYEFQARQYEQEQQARQKAVADAVTKFGALVPTLTSKDQYDQHAEQFAGLLNGMGIRVSSNFLRSTVPYVAPSAKGHAEKALNAFLKNPMNKALLEKPDLLAGAYILFDRDGDGVAEQVPIPEVAKIAEMPIGVDAKGEPLKVPKGTTPEQKANADGLLQSLLEKDKAEGKAVSPQRTIELQKQAIQQAKQAGDLGPDPTLQAIRELSLQNAKDKANQPQPTLPPATQRRIDMKTRAFDALPIVKKAQTMAEAVSFATRLDANTTNPADDQALIYAFAKAMDPDSVVREGEYATVQKYAQSWAQSFGFNAARIFSNTAFLTPQARQNMKKTITNKFAAGKQQYDNVRRSYASQINKITGQGDGDTYLTDYGAAFPDDGSGEEGQSSPAASARKKLEQR